MAGGLMMPGGMNASGGMQAQNVGGALEPQQCRDLAVVMACDMDGEVMACFARVGTCSGVAVTALAIPIAPRVFVTRICGVTRCRQTVWKAGGIQLWPPVYACISRAFKTAREMMLNVVNARLTACSTFLNAPLSNERA